MNQKKIGRFISNMRKLKNLTQIEFAEKLGVTNKTVSRWENGHYLPDVSLFNDICSILNIDVSELLNGEKRQLDDKADFNKAISNIVDISTKQIIANKKKIFIISFIIVLCLSIIFICLILKNDNNLNKYLDDEKNDNGDEFVKFPSRIALKEKEDGWVCYFTMEYTNDNNELPYYYGYNCENFKYSKLPNYIPHATEIDEDGIYSYEVSVNHPNYLYNDEYDLDLLNISNYFKDRGFNKEITISDLEELELKNISKDEVLKLYNEAIASDIILKYGKNEKINCPSYLNFSIKRENYIWSVGFINHFGHIKYINIELLIDDIYLSDLIKTNQANEEQIKIYEDIEKIEKYIIETQTFTLPEDLEDTRPYNLLNFNFSSIENLDNDTKSCYINGPV